MKKLFILLSTFILSAPITLVSCNNKPPISDQDENEDIISLTKEDEILLTNIILSNEFVFNVNLKDTKEQTFNLENGLDQVFNNIFKEKLFNEFSKIYDKEILSKKINLILERKVSIVLHNPESDNKLNSDGEVISSTFMYVNSAEGKWSGSLSELITDHASYNWHISDLNTALKYTYLYFGTPVFDQEDKGKIVGNLLNSKFE